MSSVRQKNCEENTCVVKYYGKKSGFRCGRCWRPFEAADYREPAPEIGPEPEAPLERMVESECTCALCKDMRVMGAGTG